jgi:hypothetical protein
VIELLLIKGYCRIQERDDSRAIRERVAGKLLMLDRALEPFLTPGWRCWMSRSTMPRGTPWTHRNDESGRSRRSNGCESLPPARLLLLVNYRPEYQHAWGGKTYYAQLRLDALPPKAPTSCSTPSWARTGHSRTSSEY